MIGIIRKSTIWAIGIWLICLLPASSHAENHALLIGIGNYQQRTLEGPAYDVAALTKVLIEDYDFKRKNIRTLVNQKYVLDESKQVKDVLPSDMTIKRFIRYTLGG